MLLSVFVTATNYQKAIRLGYYRKTAVGESYKAMSYRTSLMTTELPATNIMLCTE